MNLYKIVEVQNLEKYDRLDEQKPNGNYVKASEKEKFDFYIKNSFLNGKTYLPSTVINSSTNSFGFYISRYQRYYDRYFSKELMLEDLLSDEIRISYIIGKGNEFITGKYYQVASSSRLATSSFSEKKDGLITTINQILIREHRFSCHVSFEENLSIYSIHGAIISHPQMDVVVNLSTNEVYFIEVKCHEIFDEHKSIKLKLKYKDTKLINELLDISNLTEINSGKDKYLGMGNRFLLAKDFGCNIDTFHFDLKQFLCHLMGILSFQERHKNVKIHFYYLFYKNDEYEMGEQSSIYNELIKEIKTVFNVFSNKYKSIDFGYFFNDKFAPIDSIKNQYTE